MLRDDVKMIDYTISESLHTVGEVDAWQRIKTALAELGSTPNIGSLQCPFLLVERFADNGEHSHWELIDRSTGAVEWSQQAGA